MSLYSIIVLRSVYVILGLFSLYLVSWNYLLLGYVFVAVCNGVAAHRYFSHDQFEVNSFGRLILGLMATIGMYSPINYWIVQHKHHHRYSDKAEDLHSPVKGLLHASLLWPFKANVIQSAFSDKASGLLLARANRDKVIKFYSQYFVPINVLFLFLLFLIDNMIAFAYLGGCILDYFRIGLINSICHLDIPGNYKNHNTNDSSRNSLILGLITLGFGWHNNHHNDGKKLILTERWWEVDIEGYIGYLFSKVFSK